MYMLCTFIKVNDGIKGKKIGILVEGFEGVEKDLAGIVRDAALNLSVAGAEVAEVSLPIHNDGRVLCLGFIVPLENFSLIQCMKTPDGRLIDDFNCKHYL